MTTALTILLAIMVIELALVICLLLRYDDDCKNCNSHDKLPSYYHEKKPKPTKDDY